MSDYQRRTQQVIYDQKWRLLMSRGRLFKYIPFVDGALGSGSLAVGNVTEASDLDVLVLSRSGRIFTSRFFSILAFGLFGWRRRRLDHRSVARDKICLNHFATPDSYRFSLEHHAYWVSLYKGLAPVFGDRAVITAFFAANKDWLGAVAWEDDRRYVYPAKAQFTSMLERLLAGRFGSWLELQLKKFQVRRIERGLSGSPVPPRHIEFAAGKKTTGFKLKPLITYTDSELEFHPEPVVLDSL